MKLVMFDVDGTLVDSDAFDGALYAQAVREILGAEVDTSWASYRNVTDSGILDEILEQASVHEAGTARREVKRRFLELTEHYLAHERGRVREIPGAKHLVETLLAMPAVRVAVATGGWAETARLKLERIGVDLSGLALATANDSIDRVEIMRVAERRALDEASALDRFYFGDGPWDRAAARALGFTFIAVGPGFDDDPSFETLEDSAGILAELGLSAGGSAP